MNLALPPKQNHLLHSPILLTQTAQNPPILFQLPTNRRPRISRKKPIFRIHSSANANGSDGFSWPILTRSVRLGTERFFLKLGESVKKETGFDIEGVNVKVGEFVESIKGDIKKGDAALTRFRTELLTDFVDWNRWERWKSSASVPITKYPSGHCDLLAGLLQLCMHAVGSILILIVAGLYAVLWGKDDKELKEEIDETEVTKLGNKEWNNHDLEHLFKRQEKYQTPFKTFEAYPSLKFPSVSSVLILRSRAIVRALSK